MNEKIMKKKIIRKFRFSVGFLGFFTTSFFLHKYLVKNHPEFTRRTYFDRFFNHNETWETEKKRDKMVKFSLS